MTLDQTPPSADPSSPSGDEAQPLTAEEVEAQWKHRMSQRDKAHAAETEALRRELNSKLAAEETKRRVEEQARLANMSEAERWQARAKELEGQVEQERTQRVIDTRKARFPGIAAELGDEVLAAMDEGRLAALETRFAAPATSVPSLIDPNSVGRSMTQPVGPDGKTADQLKADLERMGPEFKRSLSGN